MVNPIDQQNFDEIAADRTMIAILGSDLEVYFDDDEEDEIVSTMIPSVPVMIKTLDGWEFVAPTRRQTIERLRDSQRKGEQFIDWF